MSEFVVAAYFRMESDTTAVWLQLTSMVRTAVIVIGGVVAVVVVVVLLNGNLCFLMFEFELLFSLSNISEWLADLCYLCFHCCFMAGACLCVLGGGIKGC